MAWRSTRNACKPVLAVRSLPSSVSIEASTPLLTRDVAGPDRTDVPFIRAYALSAVRVPQRWRVILHVHEYTVCDAGQPCIHTHASYASRSRGSQLHRRPPLRSPHLRACDQQIPFLVVFEEGEGPLVPFQQDWTHAGPLATLGWILFRGVGCCAFASSLSPSPGSPTVRLNPSRPSTGRVWVRRKLHRWDPRFRNQLSRDTGSVRGEFQTRRGWCGPPPGKRRAGRGAGGGPNRNRRTGDSRPASGSDIVDAVRRASCRSRVDQAS